VAAPRTRTASSTTATHHPGAGRTDIDSSPHQKFGVGACAKTEARSAQSYDHHHKKRFADFQKEAKAMKGGPSKDERQRKEQKRLEKEMAARAEALKQASSSSSSLTSAAQIPPPPPPASGDIQHPPPPPPDAHPGGELPQGGGSLKIGFSMKPLSGGGKKPSGMVMKKPAAAAKRPAAMAFGDDSD
jgi:hypothetical protein